MTARGPLLAALALPLSVMRTVIVRIFVGGHPIAEIAAAPGCHRRTVIRQRHAAITKLGFTNDPGYSRASDTLQFLKLNRIAKQFNRRGY
ncbi:hypothetical protein [Paraburkholderia phenoliruptrix]|uniref:hypothetical protein n=1 Tax=Paraburkholderia phenoliruptrix TaxID=252970 RepID=UPI002869CD01|nr:hypothetical protein [Paraburkholderia phenoliruptrix]WMY07813.1 hypothetical protein P3F88_16325 [Paraburkholderia phenoliruptrix]